MLAETLLVTEGVCKLIDYEIGPARDIQRAAKGYNDLVVISAREMSDRQAKIFEGLIFRERELEKWDSMSTMEQVTTLGMAVIRRAKMKLFGGQG